MPQAVTASTAKEQAKALIDQLPADCSYDDILFGLHAVETLATRMKQSDDAIQVVSQTVAEQRMQKMAEMSPVLGLCRRVERQPRCH